jgi:hypothetical protein
MCLCACLSSSAAESYSYQDWRFATGGNPTAPTASTNTAGEAVVTVYPGYAASGWWADLGFGTQTGLWDIGMQDTENPNTDTRGRVALALPIPSPTNPNYTDIDLRAVQLVDGFYTGQLTFSISGAKFVKRTVVEALPPPGGNWVEDEYRWHLLPAPAQVSLTITGAVGGTVLDRICISTTTSAPDPPALAIISVEQRGQALAISWYGGYPPYQVYVSSDLANDSAWQPVGPSTSETNAEVPMDLAIGMVKIRGSN